MPSRTLPVPLPAADELRFRARVERRSPGECWPWRGRLRSDRYGEFSREGVGYLAHRVAYALEHDHDPVHRVVVHTCGRPDCVNPAHLRLG